MPPNRIEYYLYGAFCHWQYFTVLG